jgi:hypothetical protein
MVARTGDNRTAWIDWAKRASACLRNPLAHRRWAHVILQRWTWITIAASTDAVHGTGVGRAVADLLADGLRGLKSVWIGEVLDNPPELV